MEKMKSTVLKRQIDDRVITRPFEIDFEIFKETPHTTKFVRTSLIESRHFFSLKWNAKNLKWSIINIHKKFGVYKNIKSLRRMVESIHLKAPWKDYIKTLTRKTSVKRSIDRIPTEGSSLQGKRI